MSAAPHGRAWGFAVGVMKRFALLAAALMLALTASFSWTLVYPHHQANTLVLVVPFGGASLFVLAAILGNGSVRVWLASFAAASVAAGAVTIAWSALSWNTGLWYPVFPRVLHRLFGTDGEASYDASDGQLFIVLFVAFMAVAVALRPRILAASKSRAWAKRHDARIDQ